MKIIIYGLMGLLLLSGTSAQAGTCLVTYKAQKIKEETFLFRTIENLVFKSGKLKGVGSTKELCEKNALSTLVKQQWKVTYSNVKMIN